MRRLLLLLATMSLFCGGTALVATGTAVAKKKSKGKCHCKRGPRGPQGATGPAGPAGPTGPTGPAGTSGTTTGTTGTLGSNYNKVVTPGTTQSITVGAFTVTNVNTGAGCGADTLQASTQPATYFASTKNGGFVGPIPNSTPFTINTAASQSSDFTAVLSTGSSTIWGIVGHVTSGANCITSGGATGA